MHTVPKIGSDRVSQSGEMLVYHRICMAKRGPGCNRRRGANAGFSGAKALRRVHHHTDRILIADFDGNPVTTVIVVYSPSNVALAEEVEKFYEDIATAVCDAPAHNFLAILGDFNARLGPEDAPFTYHDSTNRNGEHLAALLMEHEQLAANTMFQKRMGNRWTFQDRATGMLRQLDVRRRWRNSILNAEPYSTFSTVGSDHRVVSMRVRLSLRVAKPSPKTRYDWKAFSANPGLQTRYTVEVRNRFQLLGEEEEPNGKYRRFVAANAEATRLCVPVMERYRVSLRSRHPEVVVAKHAEILSTSQLQRIAGY